MISERRRAKLEEVARHRQPDLTIVVEDVHDPHNVSAMLRSCDAAGVLQGTRTNQSKSTISATSRTPSIRWSP